MRRSKANPSKTVRRYRSVSQRHMTKYDTTEAQDEAEMVRLQAFLAQAPAQPYDDDDDDEEQEEQVQDDNEKETDNFYEQQDDNDLIVLPQKKKRKTSDKPRIVLTPAEIQAHKKERQAAERKLRQLQERRQRKSKRADLEARLHETKLSSPHAVHLLQSSATLGQSLTARQRLAQALRKEQAGLALTEAEQDELYATRKNVNGNVDKEEPQPQSTTTTTTTTTSTTASSSSSSSNPYSGNEKTGTSTAAAETTTNTSKSASSWAAQMMASLQKLPTVQQQTQSAADKEESNQGVGVDDTTSSPDTFTTSGNHGKTAVSNNQPKPPSNRKQQPIKQAYVPSSPTVLSIPKGNPASNDNDVTSATRSTEKQTLLQLPTTITRPGALQELRQALPVSQMEFEIMDAIASSSSTTDSKATRSSSTSNNNNNKCGVTIICGETGSGKSTQIPQFCYEHGLCGGGNGGSGAMDNGGAIYKIGITQPRRVAAVTTAQRVAYEMQCGGNSGSSNGNTTSSHHIPPRSNNLVAYQTRYETAGLGDRTRLKFMTDGILLQEIQSDLLLRQYSVIILDEAHERNLNTDVLLGLLSVALPLRQRAAADGSLAPLKVVIMSATLRISDFTDGPLFANLATPPTIVQVPGRTHPVTIHHAKHTAMTEPEYQEAALRKILQIHRKLPPGGILVFMTGQQEIVRMCKILQRKLGVSSSKKGKSKKSKTAAASDASSTTGQSQHVTLDNHQALREMDDEEMDGDLLQDDDEVEEDAMDVNDEDEEEVGPSNPDVGEGGLPRKAIVLPLYSLLSSEEQAKVFRPVPEGHRLIVVATNIAETSITIPGISYVVDTGRQKCRNYDAGTGVASYNIMWISQAAADQRAGRAGRTGPGHCYRLYSSSLYSRQMDAFGLPEVLSRPLEDVVLSMKAMRISNVSNFPFPTPPERKQLDAAVRLLADLACLDISKSEIEGGDGEITCLGKAVAQLPLGVRYGKMVLVASEAGVMDYAIAAVSALSENSPFVTLTTEAIDAGDDDENKESDEEQDDVDDAQKSKRKGFWSHRGGDILATVLAVGAYTHAGRNAGGAAQRLACKRFCEEHGLNPVVMGRIHEMRLRLTRLLQRRLIHNGEKDKFHSLRPPNKVQERLLMQSIASGLLDNVATLAPMATFSGEYPMNLRCAYLGATSDSQEPLFLDRNSVLYTGDSRTVPKYVCYNTLIRKVHQKSGQTILSMKLVTALDPTWLGNIAKGSRLLQLETPLANPMPQYSHEQDTLLCSVLTRYGRHAWEVTPIRLPWDEAFGKDHVSSTNRTISNDDKYAWFARFLLEGKVIPELDALRSMLRHETSILTGSNKTTTMAPKSVRNLVLSIQSAKLTSRALLRKTWQDRGPRFLWSSIQPLVRPERVSEAERLWIGTARQYMAAAV